MAAMRKQKLQFITDNLRCLLEKFFILLFERLRNRDGTLLRLLTFFLHVLD